MPFLTDELMSAIQTTNNSSTGPEDIHKAILKHLPFERFGHVLNLCNKVNKQGYSLKQTQSLTKIPILKSRKSSRKSLNYTAPLH